MTIFAVWRDFGDGLDAQEIEHINVRTIAATSFFPSVRWQRSFGIDEGGRLRGVCLYEGPSLAAVEEHSRYCRLPIEEVRAVQEHLRGDVAESSSGNEVPFRLSDGRQLFMAKRTFAAGSSDADRASAWLRGTECAAEVPGLSWLRSYWDAERTSSSCILVAAGAEAVENHALISGLPCDWVHPVSENHPSLWTHVYDSMGLPRHWEQHRPTVLRS